VSTLQSWTEAACAELGLDPATVDERLILNLTRVVAHRVDRPAAPLTAFLVGLAAGRGAPLAEAVASLTALASAWPEPPDGAPAPRKDSGQRLAAAGEDEQLRQQ
jgi:hypothetical protein